jgi:hypothetical protein
MRRTKQGLEKTTGADAVPPCPKSNGVSREVNPLRIGCGALFAVETGSRPARSPRSPLLQESIMMRRPRVDAGMLVFWSRRSLRGAKSPARRRLQKWSRSRAPRPAPWPRRSLRTIAVVLRFEAGCERATCPHDWSSGRCIVVCNGHCPARAGGVARPHERSITRRARIHLDASMTGASTALSAPTGELDAG